MPENLQFLKRRVGRPSRHASPERVRELRNQGYSYRKIARVTGYGYGTVRRAMAIQLPTSRESYGD